MIDIVDNENVMTKENQKGLQYLEVEQYSHSRHQSLNMKSTPKNNSEREGYSTDADSLARSKNKLAYEERYK